MKYLLGFVFGVMVATTALSFAQWHGRDEPLDLSYGSQQWQLFWQQQQLDETRRFENLSDPCRR